MNFEDKVVIVTGGSRGIGKAIVQEFAEKGALVYFVYNKNEEAANEICRSMEEKGCKVTAVKCDVKDYEASSTVINEIAKVHKKIDILVNNAGIVKDSYLLMMPKASWNEVLDTNIGGCYNFTSNVLTHMLRNRKGSIINISSVSGIRGSEGQTNYCTSKAALIGFTKSLAKEMGKKNIRVNAVAPGFIDTDMVESVPSNLRELYLTQIPLKRFGKAEDVAKVVSFLASEDAAYINGEVIVVDGGFSA